MSMKALAGPKHVVNVRFNNLTYKKLEPKMKPEMYAIKTHEVVVRSRHPRRTTRHRITGIQSWYHDKSTFDKDYVFAGVAETSQDADHRQSYQQGLVMCVEGMVKGYNESGSMIKAGDYLTYAPNNGRTCQPGIPRNKKRVTFIRYDQANPVHARRGIVARAESGARNLEAFDAHVFANMQYIRNADPTISEIIAVSLEISFEDSKKAWDQIRLKEVTDLSEGTYNDIMRDDRFYNRVRTIHSDSELIKVGKILEDFASAAGDGEEEEGDGDEEDYGEEY